MIVTVKKEADDSFKKSLAVPESYLFYLLSKLQKEYGIKEMKINVDYESKNVTFANIILLEKH